MHSFRCIDDCMDRRALVLGGGGVTGIAWQTGLIAGLAGLGIDLAAADVIIGTSAGSVVGTDIACGPESEALYQAQLAPAARARRPDRLGLHRQAALGRAYQPGPEARPGADRQVGAGCAHHARGRPAEGLRGPAARQRLALPRPEGDRGGCADGEFAVFDPPAAASLVDAVGASCAVPGIWPPVTIGESRFMDGGMRTVANADLAHGYERVVIVAPVAAGIGFMASPRRQAAALTAAGARVALVRPDPAAVRPSGATCSTCRAGRRRRGPGGPGCGRSGGRPGRVAGLTQASRGWPDEDPGDPRPAQPIAVTRLQ